MFYMIGRRLLDNWHF